MKRHVILGEGGIPHQRTPTSDVHEYTVRAVAVPLRSSPQLDSGCFAKHDNFQPKHRTNISTNLFGQCIAHTDEEHLNRQLDLKT